MDIQRLTLLLDHYVDGDLGPEDKAELEQMLLCSPEARQAFWQHVGWHAMLREFGEQSWGGNLAAMPGPVARRPDQSPEGSFYSESPEPLAAVGRMHAMRRWPPLVALALGLAALLFAPVFFSWQRGINDRARDGKTEAAFEASSEPEATTDGIAILTRSVDASWDDTGLPTKIGSTLPTGKLKLRSGLAQLEFQSGGTVILEGPAELELHSTAQVYLAGGKLRAHIPPQAQGFVVRSPVTDLVDRGTEFGMHVGAHREAEVHVFTGKVELYRPGSDRARAASRELTTGQSLRIDAHGAATEIAAAPNSFLGAAEVDSRATALAAAQQRAWAEHRESIRNDPRVMRYYSFDPQPSWQRVLVNHAGRASAGCDGAVVGCQWTDGHWPGKGALDFRRIGDRVRIDVPGEYESLTLAASVRIDALDNPYNSILMSDDYESGGIHWQLARKGTLALGVQGPHSAGGVNYITPPIFGPDKLGQWVHLAVVVDKPQGAVTHYIDGREVSREEIRHRIPIHIGAAQLGNWGLLRHRPALPIRSFNGRMDECVLFNAALSAAEIARLAQVGPAAR
jgi:hypothetical protein